MTRLAVRIEPVYEPGSSETFAIVISTGEVLASGSEVPAGMWPETFAEVAAANRGARYEGAAGMLFGQANGRWMGFEGSADESDVTAYGSLPAPVRTRVRAGVAA